MRAKIRLKIKRSEKTKKSKIKKWNIGKLIRKKTFGPTIKIIRKK
jgi:hypothetical protein